MRFIKPRGKEQIVYGDKVICVRNHKRPAYIYDTKETGEKEFLANGEIGMVIGQRVWGKKSPSFTHIEFAGRDDRNFSFSARPFLKTVNLIWNWPTQLRCTRRREANSAL